MAFPSLQNPVTGVTVPLSALRSGQGSGIGEFPDLVPLATWCQAAGLSVIQLLPINDTSYEPSPYSALSAFALHPVYLRLGDVPGFDAVAPQARALARDLNGRDQVDHRQVWGAKQPLLKTMFEAVSFSSAEAEAWVAARPWGRTYAVFWALRERYLRAGWQEWPQHQTVDAGEIQALWQDLGAEAWFPVWLQCQAEAQLTAAVEALRGLGVALKGDIPILLNEDSADVWAHREFFDLSLRAGAPPDGMNPEGQNWGFPVYRWDALARDGYGWWKERLRHASRFYQAYRIDHVLGFFRIWATPQENHSAQLGHFQPSAPLTEGALRGLGFDEGRLLWLSEPHIPGHELRGALGDEAGAAMAQALVPVGQEDLFRFRSTITGERSLTALPLSDHARGALVQWFRNRTLVRLGAEYLPTAQYHQSRGFQSLNPGERQGFEALVAQSGARAEALWEVQGRTLLAFMKETTPMVVCAEDLGAIPDCVPPVLRDLGILGLKICRWARHWNAPGQPYIPVAAYPELSVCTPSVHDTSTLRQWWEEEPHHGGFLEALGLGPQDGPWSPDRARLVLSALMTAGSRLCMVPLQDWFGLDASLWTEDPEAERVNVPGTVGGSNWAWRMKPTLEDLLGNAAFTAQVREIADRRRKP